MLGSILGYPYFGKLPLVLQEITMFRALWNIGFRAMKWTVKWQLLYL